MKEYTPMRHIFPDGLQGLRGRVANMPFAAHNRYYGPMILSTKRIIHLLLTKKKKDLYRLAMIHSG